MVRLRGLAKSMFAEQPAVKRWEELDDVLQNSSIRLWRALEKHHPPTPLDYYRLASSIIRCELIDLFRHYFGPQGVGTNMANSWHLRRSENVSPLDLFTEGTNDPSKLAFWSEFHERVEKMPADEQLLFDLLWYQGLTASDVAGITGESERNVRRRWRTARAQLHRVMMNDQPPSMQ